MSDIFKAKATTPIVVDEILKMLRRRKGLDLENLCYDRTTYNEVKTEIAKIVYDGILNASDDMTKGSVYLKNNRWYSRPRNRDGYYVDENGNVIDG